MIEIREKDGATVFVNPASIDAIGGPDDDGDWCIMVGDGWRFYVDETQARAIVEALDRLGIVEEHPEHFPYDEIVLACESLESINGALSELVTDIGRIEKRLAIGGLKT